jgi:pyrroloquinoline quinone biosynthesis protein B
MGRLTAIVLGSAAGGGFPQWNCRCSVCSLAWGGDGRVKARTQASLAVSADGEEWTLLNASPDLRAQLQATPALQPRQHSSSHDLRNSPISAVVLTGAEVDQTAGLLTLRERQPFALCATAETLAAVAANPIFNVLAADVVTRRTVALDKGFALPGAFAGKAAPGFPSANATVNKGVAAELFSVPGKVPLYLEGGDPDVAREGEGNVGVELRAGDKRLLFVPGAARLTPALEQRLAGADAVLFDGTLFRDDEMISTGTGTKTGRRMGHMPIDGEGGSLAALARCSARRIYIHINNTNPILVDGAPERRKVEAAGWEIAEDGMRIEL